MFLKRSNYKVIGESDFAIDESEVGSSTANFDEDGTIRNMPPQSHDVSTVSFEGMDKQRNVSITSNHNQRDWEHIDDIDRFFTNLFKYYQGNGFTCIAFKKVYSLIEFVFVVWFSAFLAQCVDYDILFNKGNTTASVGGTILRKRIATDLIVDQCILNMNPIVKLALFFASVFFLYQLLGSAFYLIQFFKIRLFYNNILDIKDSQLSNISWHEVVERVCSAQKRLHIVVNQDNITPLDVYQRILRHQNYLTAMIYYDILPPKLMIPFIGRLHYFPRGLYINLKYLLFSGPWSPWKSSYALKDEFKDPLRLDYLSDQMKRTVTWMSIANLAFFPLLTIYQILYSFFSYCDMVKRDPNVFGMRKYSNYGREVLRHYNELDSELDCRLNQSYKFAARYMDQFISPLVEVHARFVAFIAAAVFTILFALSAWDEDVLNVEHLITLMTASGLVVLACRSFISSENAVHSQDILMQQIIANIHYAPKAWAKNPQSTDVYAEFSQLFKLKIQCLVEDLLAPLLMPYVLYFHIRGRCSEFVSFIHNNTRYIEGLGDICQFAQMDLVQKNAHDGPTSRSYVKHPALLETAFIVRNRNETTVVSGKSELSLLNFSKQNPKWTPNKDSSDFINKVREMATSSTLGEGGGLLFPTTCNNCYHSSNSIVDSQALIRTTFSQLSNCMSPPEESYARANEMSVEALVVNHAMLLSNTITNEPLAKIIKDRMVKSGIIRHGKDNGQHSISLATNEILQSDMLSMSSHLPILTVEEHDSLSNNRASNAATSRHPNLTSALGQYGTIGGGLGLNSSLETSNLWGVPRNTEFSQICVSESITEEENEKDEL